MKLTTAGESHGKQLIGIIEGMPSNLKIDINEIDEYLALRQGGYGRGPRAFSPTESIAVFGEIIS